MEGPEESAPAAASHAPSPRLVLLGVLALMVLGHFVYRSHDPPEVVAADAPGNVFSAARARHHLEDLLGEGEPHPLGTPANDEVRSRLVAHLEKLGLDPRVKAEWLPTLSTWSTGLVRTVNVTVELPTSRPELPAILLACHYDSVPAGPGAADDGAGVATLLEVARILSLESPLPRPVILLFTDGEELGLYGARSFTRSDPLAKRVGMVVNLEARGTAGPSLFFETSADNHWIVRQASKGLPSPMSSSAYVHVYRSMPNSTDLTIFLRRQLAGMNFAFIGNPKHYHTPLDNLAQLDARSLQHHGENTLGMARQLLSSDWQEPIDGLGDAVHTDLLGRWLITWPARWGPILAGIVLLVALGLSLLASTRHRWKRSTTRRAVALWILAYLSGAGCGWLAAYLLQTLDPHHSSWPSAYRLDVTCVCLGAALGILLTLLRFREDPGALLTIHLLGLAVGGLFLSLVVGSFSYLFLLPAIPTLVAILCLHPSPIPPARLLCASLLSAVPSVVLGVPFLRHLPDALGVGLAAPVLGGIVAFLLLPLLPLLSSLAPGLLRRSALALLIAGVACAILALREPTYTPTSPQRINLTYLERDGASQAQLSALAMEPPLPASLLADRQPLPSAEALFTVPGTPVAVEPVGITPPTAQLVSLAESSPGIHHAVLRLQPAFEGQEVLVGLPLDHIPQELEAEGIALRHPPEDRDNRRWIRFRGLSASGIELSCSWTGPADLPVVLVGTSLGLPTALAPIAAKRNALPAATSHFGDQTVAVRELRFTADP